MNTILRPLRYKMGSIATAILTSRNYNRSQMNKIPHFSTG